MTDIRYIVWCCCIAITLCDDVPQSEVDEYVRLINELEEDALTWIFPEDSSSYLERNEEDDYTECSADGIYDFIIVGGGSTGCVLADRLSEIPHWKILLLEAGGLENKITDIPALYNYLVASEFNWGYNSVQLQNFGEYLNRSVSFPAGRVLGGSGVINNMYYARGNKEDFNKWASLGNPGWSYAEVLPYFKKSENAKFPNADPEYHGTDGPLSVEYVPYVDEITETFLQAQQELKRKILDYNGKEQLGFSVVQVNQIGGSRDSGARAFWEPIHRRRNLNTSLNTLVLKILIDENSKRAFGVKYLRNGTCYYARAKKEIIVSAGALNSPQLLMLSGIGPKSHLEEMGIKVLQNSRVGDNFWNHLSYASQSFSVNYSYPYTDEETDVREYLHGQGVYTTGAGLQGIGYLNLLNDSSVPDVSYFFSTSAGQELPYNYFKNVFRFTPDAYQFVVKPLDNVTSYNVNIAQLHSKSRGTIRLKSKSPLDFPLLDPNYFQDPDDVGSLLRGIRDLQKIANTSALRKLGAKMIHVSLPVCEKYTYDSDDFWTCMIKNLALVLHHYAGTCKMGPSSDNTAVVDPYLRVYGITNLRVMDCSVIPVTISGNTNAAAYMIGEKGADLLKLQYN